MRFQSRTENPRRQAVPAPSRRGPSLRLAAMLGAMVVVLAAMARLEQPETHRALGQVLGEPVRAEVADFDQPHRVPPETFSAVQDNAPFREGEQQAWFATIEVVRQETSATLSVTSVGAVGYAALTTQPDSYRGRVVTVSGTVRRVEAVTPAENELGIDRLWCVTIEPTGGEVWPITVYTITEPRDATEPYDASAVGVFFKNLSYRWAEGVALTPVLVAPRLETTIDTPTAPVADAVAPSENAIDFEKPANGSLGRALLTDLGVDLIELDAVSDRRRLTSKDTVAFYEVLAAVAKTPATQLVRLARVGLDDYVRRHADRTGESARDRQTLRALRAEQQRQRYSVVPLFGDGASERGELVAFDAVVRRAVRVDASASGAATSRGVTHYYELEAFPEDSQNLPIVFVVRDLPAGFPVGDAIRQPARLAGFFFKQWAYRTRKPSETDPASDRRQFAPLLVGRAPIPLAVPDNSASRPGMAIGITATAGLAAIAAALWRLNRQDRRYESTTLSRYRRHGDEGSRDFARLGESPDSP